MDKLNTYRQVVQQVVAHHAQYSASQEQIEALSICDATNDNYILLDVGWDRTGRVHDIALHLRLRDGKIWIEWDGIEEGVTQELLELGVPKEDIVLGFYRPQRRQLTEFAVN
ncbi:MAG: XisI protein [Hormoscilla sp. GM102CHS1]|nr:XisI protein [Hormoscilla sp. GM102CHS1]